MAIGVVSLGKKELGARTGVLAGIVLVLVVVLVLETCVFSAHFPITDELDLREHASFCHIGDASERLIENEDDDEDENESCRAVVRAGLRLGAFTDLSYHQGRTLCSLRLDISALSGASPYQICPWISGACPTVLEHSAAPFP